MMCRGSRIGGLRSLLQVRSGAVQMHNGRLAPLTLLRLLSARPFTHCGPPLVHAQAPLMWVLLLRVSPCSRVLHDEETY